MRKAGRFLRLLTTEILLAVTAVIACAPGFAQTASAYDAIAVVQPANDATVFDNAGNVDVTVAVSPDVRSGDRIALILDGRRSSVQEATHFKLSKIARGEHTLEARVVDSSDTTVISSDPVKFYLWQASRLFPARRAK